MEQSIFRRGSINGLVVVAAIAAGVHLGCSAPPPILTQLMDARRLASQLHVEFTKAAEAANRG